MIVEKEFDFKGSLRAVRESRGLTQQQLGDLIGESSNTVSNWEMPSGKSKPSISKLRLICIALNCPPGDLLGLSPSEMTSDEYNLLKRFRAADAKGKRAMLECIDLVDRFMSDG